MFKENIIIEKFYKLYVNCSRKYKYLEKLVSGDIDRYKKKCNKCGNYVEVDKLIYKNLVFEASEDGKLPA